MSAFRVGVLSAGLVFLAATLEGQEQDESSTEAPATAGFARNGPQIYSASAFAAYYSIAAPTSGLSWYGADLGSEATAGGQVVAGYRRKLTTGFFSAIYMASYRGHLRYSEWSGLDQRLTLNGERRSGRMSVDLSADASVSRFSELAFQAAPRISGTDGPAEPAVQAGVITGALDIAGPAQMLVYGTRVLGVSAHLSASYAASPRLSLTVTGGGAQMQHIADRSDGATAENYLVPRTTTAEAGVSAVYSLAPRTKVGVHVQGGRTASPLSDYYSTIASGFVSRTLSKDWVIQGQAGFGTTVRSESGDGRRNRASLFGGSISRSVGAHSLSLGYVRGIADEYGLGAGWTGTAVGSWSWKAPGGSWSVFCSGSQEMLRGGDAINVDGWAFSVGLLRRLTLHTGIQWRYSYVRNQGLFEGGRRELEQHAVQIAFVWQPGDLGGDR